MGARVQLTSLRRASLTELSTNQFPRQIIMSQSEDPSSNQSSETALPTPCVGGCGFYGSAETKNYCSQCYKKMFPEKITSPPSNNNNKKNKNEDKNEESKENDNDKECIKIEEDKKPKKKVQKKKNRCWQCRKKMSLAGQFECKCGYVFCGKHRYPDSHECDIDFKKIHQKKLAKDNKTVAPSKLDKI